MNVLEEILYPLITEAHGSMESSRNITLSPNAVLFGTEGFNSLDLVSFIIMTEEKVDDATGVRPGCLGVRRELVPGEVREPVGDRCPGDGRRHSA